MQTFIVLLKAVDEYEIPADVLDTTIIRGTRERAVALGHEMLAEDYESMTNRPYRKAHQFSDDYGLTTVLGVVDYEHVVLVIPTEEHQP